ncbi:hypothetical protein G9A89_008787 [Geosiphon pyriformis]|nr:hypothetical protein G9A89_008787 [Geosiphon pyriformis]
MASTSAGSNNNNINNNNIDIPPTPPRIRVSSNNDGTSSPSNRRSLYMANNQSPVELKKKLQDQLLEKSNQIRVTAEFGQQLVQQKEQIEQRIRELEETQGDVISPELQNKLAQLEKEAMSLDAETRNVFMSASSQGTITNSTLPLGATSSTSPIPISVLDQALTPEPPAATASRTQTRRIRNQNRTNDVEFAAEIGQNLLKEVKRLQALLQDKEEKIKELEFEKAELERTIESLTKKLCAREEAEETLKAQVWELEVKIQSLDTEKDSQTIEVSRLRKEIQLQEKKLSDSTDLLENVKAREVKLSSELTESKQKYDRQTRAHKKAYNDLKKENQVISQALDESKQENISLKTKLKRKDEMASTAPSIIHFPVNTEPAEEKYDDGVNGENLATIVDKFLPALNQFNPQAADAVKQISDEFKVLQVKNGSLQSENEELKNLLGDREEEIDRLREESSFPPPHFKAPLVLQRKNSANFSQDGLKGIAEDTAIMEEPQEYMEERGSDEDDKIIKTNRPTSAWFQVPREKRYSRPKTNRVSLPPSSGYTEPDVPEEDDELIDVDEMITEPIINEHLNKAQPSDSTAFQGTEEVNAARNEALENLTNTGKALKSDSSSSDSPKNITSEIFEEPDSLPGTEDVQVGPKMSKRNSIVQKTISIYEGIAKRKPSIPNIKESMDTEDDDSSEDYQSALSQRESTASQVEFHGGNHRDSILTDKEPSSPLKDKRQSKNVDNLDDATTPNKIRRETFVSLKSVEVQTLPVEFKAQSSLTETGVQTDSVAVLRSIEELKVFGIEKPIDDELLKPSSSLSTDISENNNLADKRFTLDLGANSRSIQKNPKDDTLANPQLQEQNVQRSKELRTPPDRPTSGPPQTLLETFAQTHPTPDVAPTPKDKTISEERPIDNPQTVGLNSKGKGKEGDTSGNKEGFHHHTSSSGSISTGSTVSSTVSSTDRGPNRDSNNLQAEDSQSPFGGGPRLDPSTVQAITLTMMGEFLHKYTRRNFGGGTSEKRHPRFFWVHPYTRTLYWSTKDPGGADMTDAKSSKNSMLSMQVAYIESVKAVVDHNPSPTGLYHMSLVVKTPGREIKFTAPTKERHEIWLKALNYLIERGTDTDQSQGNNAATGTAVPRMASDPWENQPSSDMRTIQQTSSSNNNLRAASFPPQDLKKKSSFSKLSALIRREGSSTQPAPSPLAHEHHHPSTSNDDDLSMVDDMDEDFENVRECCDGRHNINDLAGKRHRRN